MQMVPAGLPPSLPVSFPVAAGLLHLLGASVPAGREPPRSSLSASFVSGLGDGVGRDGIGGCPRRVKPSRCHLRLRQERSWDEGCGSVLGLSG